MGILIYMTFEKLNKNYKVFKTTLFKSKSVYPITDHYQLWQVDSCNIFLWFLNCPPYQGHLQGITIKTSSALVQQVIHTDK